MKTLFGMLTAAALFAASAAGATDARKTGDEPVPGQKAGQTTSDRTPEDTNKTPLSQTTKTDGETSDRTPPGSSDGAGAGDGAAGTSNSQQ